MTIRILIADDHPLIAEGIKNTFINQPEFKVVAMATNGKEALEIVKSNLIDVVLLDIDMPEMNGIDCAREITKHYSQVKVAMLSMHQEASLIRELIAIGVKGYMLKTIPTDELLLAIKTIYNGKDYFTADVTKAILNTTTTNTSIINYTQKSPLIHQLTDREKEIIGYLTQGYTNPQIGEKLFISPRTVDTHRTNIMKKIGVNNVASLIRFAFQNGLAS